MMSGELSADGLVARIDAIVGNVQKAFREETGVQFEPQLVEDSMVKIVGDELARIEDNLLEMFTSPHRREFHELATLLERNRELYAGPAQVENEVAVALEHNDESVFEGHRPYSHTKYAAMMEYLTGKGIHVYKTSLNKLLFYSDLTMFYLTNHGISGAVYHNRPFGPVADSAEPLLNSLVAKEKVQIDPRLKTYVANDGELSAALSPEEKKVLDWVAATYGDMKASEISEHSHREMAYKFTQPNEPIAYAYGKFFERLPPKDLLA
ncbi:MAG: Panacea domain-containing protein [Pyrinomonadaceae bacterium]